MSLPNTQPPEKLLCQTFETTEVLLCEGQNDLRQTGVLQRSSEGHECTTQFLLRQEVLGTPFYEQVLLSTSSSNMLQGNRSPTYHDSNTQVRLPFKKTACLMASNCSSSFIDIPWWQGLHTFQWTCDMLVQTISRWGSNQETSTKQIHETQISQKCSLCWCLFITWGYLSHTI